jgi:serine/threonine-protein kinase RsbW
MIVNSPHKLDLDSSFQSLARVEKFIEEICDECHVSEDYFGNILIAVTEAVNNAIQHGNKLDPTKKIHMVAEQGNQSLVFRISDQGNGFNYTSIPDPTDPENLEKPNGRGIFLMKNLADKITFEENGRVVNLFFEKVS